MKQRPLSETKFINDANLQAYWKFEGNSLDETANNNDGTDTSITYSTANGKFGQGAGFNGTTSFINVGNDASLQLGAGPFTFNIWFKKAANSYVGSIYHDNAGTANFFSIGTNSDNTLFLYVTGNTGSNSLLSSTSTITDTNWHLLTVVVESASSRKIYIDGAYNNVSTASITGNISSIRDKNIGRSTNNSEYFNGAIDDVAIFNRALSADEVNELYQGMTLGEYLGAGSSTTKLLLHLNGNSTDSSGNGNNGTDTSITYSQANGKFGQGAGFNNSNSIISVPLGDLVNDWTYSFWVKSSGIPSVLDVVMGKITTTSSGRQIEFLIGSDARVRVSIPYIKTILASASTISANTWYNLIFTKSSTTWNIYINGKLDASVVDATAQQTSTSPLIIGNSNLLSGDYYFGGSIDEVIIENTAWSAEKVKKYYTFSKGRFHL